MQRWLRLLLAANARSEYCSFLFRLEALCPTNTCRLIQAIGLICISRTHKLQDEDRQATCPFPCALACPLPSPVFEVLLVQSSVDPRCCVLLDSQPPVQRL